MYRYFLQKTAHNICNPSNWISCSRIQVQYILVQGQFSFCFFMTCFLYSNTSMSSENYDKLRSNHTQNIWCDMYFSLMKNLNSNIQPSAACCGCVFFIIILGKKTHAPPSQTNNDHWGQLEVFALPSEVTLYVTKDKKLLFFYFGFALNERWCKDCW